MFGLFVLGIFLCFYICFSAFVPVVVCILNFVAPKYVGSTVIIPWLFPFPSFILSCVVWSLYLHANDIVFVPSYPLSPQSVSSACSFGYPPMYQVLVKSHGKYACCRISQSS